jgi:hypothetical protein
MLLVRYLAVAKPDPKTQAIAEKKVETTRPAARA